jgi:ribosome maturation factor RimP
MAAISGRVLRVIEPVIDELDVDLFDVEQAGGKLIVTIDRSPGGVDIDVIAKVTRALSRALDEAEPIDGRYVLEVTSPGLERPLRDARHYRWAVGKQVSVRVSSPDSTEAGERRCTGTLLAADDEGIELRLDGPDAEVVHLAYASIQKGRTVVDWDAELRAGSEKQAAAGDPESNQRPATKPGPSRRDSSKDGATDKRVSNR